MQATMTVPIFGNLKQRFPTRITQATISARLRPVICVTFRSSRLCMLDTGLQTTKFNSKLTSGKIRQST